MSLFRLELVKAQQFVGSTTSLQSNQVESSRAPEAREMLTVVNDEQSMNYQGHYRRVKVP